MLNVLAQSVKADKQTDLSHYIAVFIDETEVPASSRGVTLVEISPPKEKESRVDGCAIHRPTWLQKPSKGLF